MTTIIDFCIQNLGTMRRHLPIWTGNGVILLRFIECDVMIIVFKPRDSMFIMILDAGYLEQIKDIVSLSH